MPLAPLQSPNLNHKKTLSNDSMTLNSNFDNDITPPFTESKSVTTYRALKDSNYKKCKNCHNVGSPCINCERDHMIEKVRKQTPKYSKFNSANNLISILDTDTKKGQVIDPITIKTPTE